jgi:hypothetical protein
MQKARLADPLFLFHQLGLHDGDLTSGAAKAYESKLQPEPKRIAETWMLNCRRLRV